MLLWPLTDCLAWGHPATMVSFTTVEGTALASVILVVVAQPATVVEGHVR
jgi:hypothetical protein